MYLVCQLNREYELMVTPTVMNCSMTCGVLFGNIDSDDGSAKKNDL